MFGGPAMSNDLNLPFPSSPFRHQQGNHNKQQQQQQEEHEHLHRQQHHMSSNLLRYRSAPTSVLGGDAAAACAEEFLRAGPQVSEAESMFARFMAPPDHPMGEKHHHQNGPAIPMHAAAATAAAHGHPQMLFQLHQQHPPSMQGLGPTDVTAQFRIDDDEHGGGGAKGGAGAPGLARHSSSPAGLTPHLNVENGFGGSSRVGSNGAAGFRPCSNGTAERLKTQISFSSRGPSGSSTFLSQISELGPTGDGSSDEGGGSGGERCYMPAGFPVATWEDSVLLSESFKRVRDPSEMQNGVSVSLAMGGGGGGGAGAGGGGPVRSLSGDVERYLQFQDAVPCKVRAKRGCATHPRSIAERVRRTRISERIRKLQELVPNMDKQTNTADMLDLAVEYIKELQKQAKVLSDDRANCTCNSNGRQ